MIASGGARPATSSVLREIQIPVAEELARVPPEMWRIAAADAPLVGNVTQHLMGMRGKMFRPTLLLLSSAVEQPAPSRAVTMAALIELIHLATLIHDDAVDHSVLRRGRPTVNSAFSHEVAVIMGDYLYARAFAVLVEDADLEVMRAITRASTEMTLGELRQLGSLEALKFSEEDYETLIRSKTASLFSASCEVGAIVGGRQHRSALAHYGERLGMAFQVADDLLDYTSDAGTTGKPAGLDLREHKVTLPLIAALRNMGASERKEVERLFASSDPDDDAIATVTAIVREQGGLEYARQRGEGFAQEAEAALTGLPEGAVRSALADAIGYVLDRRS